MDVIVLAIRGYSGVKRGLFRLIPRMNLNRLSGGFYLERRLAVRGNQLGFNSNFIS